MRVIGIDPSLRNTGLCIIDEDENICTYSLGSPPSWRIFPRQRHIVHSIGEYLKKDDVVVFEDFGVSARFAPSGKFCERIELCGMLKFFCYNCTGVPWLSITPTALKSFIAGKSSAHKEEVFESVKNVWHVPASNDDEADAFGLARYGLAILKNESIYEKKIKKCIDYGLNREHLAAIRFILKI